MSILGGPPAAGAAPSGGRPRARRPRPPPPCAPPCPPPLAADAQPRGGATNTRSTFIDAMRTEMWNVRLRLFPRKKSTHMCVCGCKILQQRCLLLPWRVEVGMHESPSSGCRSICPNTDRRGIEEIFHVRHLKTQWMHRQETDASNPRGRWGIATCSEWRC